MSALGIDLGTHFGRVGWPGPDGEPLTADPVRLDRPVQAATALGQLASLAPEHPGGGRRRVALSLPPSGTGEMALRRAAESAGLAVAHAVPAPVAAALHYRALTEGAQSTVLVCDQGAASLDLTVLTVSGDRTVRITDTVSHPVGGNDWDAAVAAELLRQIAEAHPDGAHPAEPDAALRGIAARLRRALGGEDGVRDRVTWHGLDCELALDRDTVARLTAGPRERAQAAVEAVLSAATERPGGQPAAVLAAGGLFATPGLAAALERRTGLYVRCVAPELAVVRGLVLLAGFGVLRVLTGRQAQQPFTPAPAWEKPDPRPDPEPPSRTPSPDPESTPAPGPHPRPAQPDQHPPTTPAEDAPSTPPSPHTPTTPSDPHTPTTPTAPHDPTAPDPHAPDPAPRPPAGPQWTPRPDPARPADADPSWTPTPATDQEPWPTPAPEPAPGPPPVAPEPGLAAPGAPPPAAHPPAAQEADAAPAGVVPAAAVPVTQLQAVRRDDHLQVFWAWPDGGLTARVRWRVEGRTPGRPLDSGDLTCSRRMYEHDGGLDLVVGRGPVTLTVEALVPGPAQGPEEAASLRVAAEPPVVRYLPAVRRRLTGRTATVTFESDGDCELPRQRVVYASGRFRPMNANEGRVVHEVPARRLRAGAPHTVEFAFPATRGPSWLVCFPADSADSADPADPASPDVRPQALHRLKVT